MTPLVFELVTGREARRAPAVHLASRREPAGDDVIVRVTDPTSVWHGQIGTATDLLSASVDVELLAAGVRVSLPTSQLTAYHPTASGGLT